MKVLLINGSPKTNGCTYTALSIAAEELEKNDIETEIFQVGLNPIRGCIGCGMCAKDENGLCCFGDDAVNDAIKACETADGIIIGSPVHYASASGAITSFMDRLFYAGGSKLRYKPGAVVASCRRGGASATLDQLTKYFGITSMPVVSSNYWNMVHGNTPDEVLKDEEGVQTMRVLGKNMAWMLKTLDAAKKSGVNPPEPEAKIKTNYIR